MRVCCCGPGGRWWQPTTGSMTMHAVTCRLTASEIGISSGPLRSITSMGTFTFTYNVMVITSAVLGKCALILQTTCKTVTGQNLDLITAPVDRINFAAYTIDRYNAIVEYKTAYYSFYLPVACALYLVSMFSVFILSFISQLTVGYVWIWLD